MTIAVVLTTRETEAAVELGKRNAVTRYTRRSFSVFSLLKTRFRPHWLKTRFLGFQLAENLLKTCSCCAENTSSSRAGALVRAARRPVEALFVLYTHTLEARSLPGGPRPQR